MTLPHPCSKYNAVLLFLLCLGCLSHLHAQQFDQSYGQWKAQQQVRDQQLAKQSNNNYYLSRPTQQSSSKSVSSSVNQQGDKISLTQAIVEYRQKNGGFKTIDELVNVKGIGPKLLEKNKARLML